MEIFSLAARYEGITARVKAAAQRGQRSSESVRLVAVTKNVDVDRMQKATALGIRDFGESRVQEVQSKLHAFAGADVNWHFIGHLQTNKVKRVVGEFSLIHSVDSWRLAEALSREAESRGLVQSVLYQVNVSGESSKHGLRPDEVTEILVRTVKELPGIQVKGLMTVAPYAEDPEAARPHFRRLRLLRESCAPFLPELAPLEHLSMGMTQDFEVAVEEGATLIRIGSGLFGPRESPPPSDLSRNNTDL